MGLRRTLGAWRVIGAGAGCVLAIAGCGDSADDDKPSAAAAAAPAAAEFPVSVENCGRTLTFDKAPSKAVLSYHPIAEIFVGLGLGDRAIGRVGFKDGSGLQEPPLLPEQVQSFKAIPVVSNDVYPPAKEKLLSLRSDFLLAYGDFDYDTAEGRASIRDLEAAGTKVYSVICPPGQGGGHEGESIEDVYGAILDLGKIFGVSDAAEQRVEQMKRQIADVRTKVADEPAVKALFYMGGTGPLGIQGGTGIRQELLTIAGGENVFAQQSESYFEASVEKVASTKPDVFVVNASYETPTGALDVSDETKLLFDSFPNMPATKARRVVVSDYAYTSPGWRVAQTAEDLARELHPKAFG